MSTINRTFILLIFVVGMGLLALISSTAGVVNSSKDIRELISDRGVQSISLGENIPDSYVSGENVIGLAKKASEGKIILILDGIQIDSEATLATVNLRNVVGAKYELQYYYSDVLDLDVVVAAVR